MSDENPEFSVSKNDSLRDRIAAAIRAADTMPSSDIDPYIEMADAVIAELNLHQQDEEDEYGGYKRTGRYRWVTDWKADDE